MYGLKVIYVIGYENNWDEWLRKKDEWREGGGGLVLVSLVRHNSRCWSLGWPCTVACQVDPRRREDMLVDENWRKHLLDTSQKDRTCRCKKMN